MHYYIVENTITGFYTELDPQFYNNTKLTQAEADFYEANNCNCSLQEVLNLKLNEPYIPSLEEQKAMKLEYFEQKAFEVREAIVPTYKLINASLDIYSAEIKAQYQAIVNAFRTEYYRLKALVELAENAVQLSEITDNYESLQW